MSCKALWENEILKIGDDLSASYLSRLNEEGLLQQAREREHHGDAGGRGREETDRHFAFQFANSAARVVYLCTDPVGLLAEASNLVRQSFTDGRVLLIEVPCGAGAGAFGLLSALCEQRRARALPTLPLSVDVLGGDISERALEHFESLAGKLAPKLAAQCVDIELHTDLWDVTDIRSSSRFIDRAVSLAEECDQVFLLVSNFSDALEDGSINESFQHFLSQFTGRMREPSSVCWVEPISNKADRIISRFYAFLSRLLKVLQLSGKELTARYHFFDPARSRQVRSGLRLLRAVQERLP